MNSNQNILASLVVIAAMIMGAATSQAVLFAEYQFSTETLSGGAFAGVDDVSGNNRDLSASGVATRETDSPSWGSTPDSHEQPTGGITDTSPIAAAPFISLFDGSNDFSIETSVKFPSFLDGYILSTVGTTSGGFYINVSPAGTLGFAARGPGSGGATDPSNLSLATWYNVVLTFDAGANDLLLYRTDVTHDGTLAPVASNLNVTIAEQIGGTPNGFVLGQFNSAGGVYTDMRNNNIRIFDSVLAPSEFQSFVAPTVIPEPSSMTLLVFGAGLIRFVGSSRRRKV